MNSILSDQKQDHGAVRRVHLAQWNPRLTLPLSLFNPSGKGKWGDLADGSME
jgi:hypothetical protein